MSTIVSYIGQKIDNFKSQRPNERLVLPYFSIEQVNTFRSIFGFLNDKDRDILYLIFVSRKKQKDVQCILKRSQPSLCYDIKRIRCRLRYIFYLYSVFDIFIEFTQSCKDFFSPTEMEILTYMFYTSSFTMTSEKVGLSQVKTRYAFNKCLRRMEALEMWEQYEIFKTIRFNLNTIKRVYKGSGNISEKLTNV